MNMVNGFLGKAAGFAAGVGSLVTTAANAQEGPKLPPLMVPPAAVAPETPGVKEAEPAPILIPQERKSGPELFLPVPAQAEPKTQELVPAEPKSAERNTFTPNIDGVPREGGAIRIEKSPEEKNALLFAKLDAISAALQAHKRHPMNIPIKIPANANTDQKMGAYLNHFKQIAPIVAQANGRISEGPRMSTAPIAKTNKQELSLELGFLIDAMFNGRVGTGSNLDNRIDILMEVLRIDAKSPKATQKLEPTPDPFFSEKALENEPVPEIKPEPYSPRVAPPLPAPEIKEEAPAPTLESGSETKFDAPRFQ